MSSPHQEQACVDALDRHFAGLFQHCDWDDDLIARKVRQIALLALDANQCIHAEALRLALSSSGLLNWCLVANGELWNGRHSADQFLHEHATDEVACWQADTVHICDQLVTEAVMTEVHVAGLV